MDLGGEGDARRREESVGWNYPKLFPPLSLSLSLSLILFPGLLCATSPPSISSPKAAQPKMQPCFCSSVCCSHAVWGGDYGGPSNVEREPRKIRSVFILRGRNLILREWGKTRNEIRALYLASENDACNSLLNNFVLSDKGLRHTQKQENMFTDFKREPLVRGRKYPIQFFQTRSRYRGLLEKSLNCVPRSKWRNSVWTTTNGGTIFFFGSNLIRRGETLVPTEQKYFSNTSFESSLLAKQPL